VGVASPSFLVFCIAWLGSGGMLGLAVGLYLHHARRSRLSGFALQPSASPEEGPALLRGLVERAEDDQASPQERQSMHTRPFILVLRSGARVRVEPEEGKWSIDATVGGAGHDADVYPEGIIGPGNVVYIRGTLKREDAPGKWVMRGDLSFCSEAVIVALVHRAAFHRAWGLGLAALFALVYLVRPLGMKLPHALVALLVVIAAGVAYRVHAKATSPRFQRKRA